MKNKDKIAILNKRVDTLYEWVAYIQKHTQAGINSGEKLHLDSDDIDSLVKKNFTTQSSVQKMHDATFVEVPFSLYRGNVRFNKSGHYFFQYCKDKEIDQKRINRIWLEMKSEEE